MEKIIPIQTDEKTYDVTIGNDVLPKFTLFLESIAPSKICIITDETVRSFHIDSLLNALPDSIPHCLFVTPSGEKAKSMDVYVDVLTYAIREKLDRSSLFIAFGGGAVGDVTGFCASTFLRGIPFIQVPTTLLAHDSSVGGKTGINHPMGKNLIGTFHHPEAVFYHLPFLNTLPKKEWRSGFAEIIKASLISDQPFFDELKRSIRNEKEINIERIIGPLVRAIETKKRIVELDERERGERAFLNFGHTLGHALENELGYGTITHGEAVLIGMIYALRLSHLFYDLPISDTHVSEWAENLGFHLPIVTKTDPFRLLNRMKNDKKTKYGKCNFVLLKKIGQPILKEVDDETIIQTLTQFISDMG